MNMGTISAVLAVTLLADTYVGGAEYDRYGGAKSVKGEATGFFDFQELADRWWLITPEGHGFVSLGVVHISQGERQPIFTEKYRGDRGVYYADVAKNLKSWGFNSAGYSCTYQSRVEMSRHLPFVVNIEVLKTALWWGKRAEFSDVFDPAWQRQAAAEIAKFCRPVKDSKNLIGYFTTDLPNWSPRTVRSRAGWLDYYRALPADAPGKKHYVSFLITRVGSAQAVAERYGVPRDSAADLAAITEWRFDADDATILADDKAFVAEIAAEYYRFCAKAIEAADPNHLYFGDRFASNRLEPAIIAAAGKHVDGFAVQPFIRKAQFPKAAMDALHKQVPKPIVICDFAVNFPTDQHSKVMWDAGAKTEDEAADLYKRFLDDAFVTPYIVGVHRCTYIDLPRPNVLKQGLIRQDGSAYQTTVTRYAEIHRRLYDKVYSSR